MTTKPGGRVLRRIAIIAGLAALGAAAVAAPAAAHVTIDPGEVEAGSYARLDLRVPNESEEAGTVKVEMTLPEDHPFASVRTEPVPGWTVEAEKRTLDTPIEVHGRQITEAVGTITWTADDDEAGVRPGQFVEFGLSVGPVPDAVGTTLLFKTIQTYSDGTEAPWIAEPAAEGAAEPDNPAPALTIVAASGGEHGTPAGDDDDADDVAEDADDDGNTWPLVLSIIALVVAVAGAGAALAVARAAGRRGDPKA